jgi:hypothetical protein
MYNLGTYGCETVEKRAHTMRMAQTSAAAKQAAKAREGDLAAQVRELERRLAAISAPAEQPERRGPGRPPKRTD